MPSASPASHQDLCGANVQRWDLGFSFVGLLGHVWDAYFLCAFGFGSSCLTTAPPRTNKICSTGNILRHWKAVGNIDDPDSLIEIGPSLQTPSIAVTMTEVDIL